MVPFSWNKTIVLLGNSVINLCICFGLKSTSFMAPLPGLDNSPLVIVL